MSAICVIPARYGSTRFPGKPLALLGGRPVIQWVYEAASRALDRVVVATDDSRIFDAVKSFGGEAVMTSPDCPNGTARCLEACRLLEVRPDEIVVNVQGDEPFISPDDILAVASLAAESLSIATLVYRAGAGDAASILSPDTVKAVLDDDRNALYFSRLPIPYFRGTPALSKKSLSVHGAVCAEPLRSQVTVGIGPEDAYHLHQGIYAYTMRDLTALVALPPSPLSLAESLEQLTWLQSGHHIRCALTTHRSIGIDTPADLTPAERMLTVPR